MKKLPLAVLKVLRFYAHGNHLSIDKTKQDFAVDKERSLNWLRSQQSGDKTSLENGSMARLVLLDRLECLDEFIEEPIKDEAFLTCNDENENPEPSVDDEPIIKLRIEGGYVHADFLRLNNLPDGTLLYARNGPKEKVAFEQFQEMKRVARHKS